MNARIGAETGFRQCGIVYLCETDAELAAREKWYVENARPFGLDTRLVSGEEAGPLQPGSTRQWKGALYSPADGRAEPFIAAAGNCGGCAEARRENFHQLRRARAGNSGGPRLGCGDGEGRHSLR